MGNLHVLARKWIGTPFVHQGRSGPGGAGVDCLGLLVGVAALASLAGLDGHPLAASDVCDYGRYPDIHALRAALDRSLRPADDRPIAPDQIALFEFDRRAQHLGILGSIAEEGRTVTTVIHAYAPVGRVVEHRLAESWRRRIVARYATDG